MEPSLFRIDQGKGDVVLLLHSGGMSSRQWKRLIETLSPNYRVIAPDFVGSGFNLVWPDEKPFHFNDDVAAIEELVSDVASPLHIVGHSYGGLIGLTFARRHPERVRSIALFEPVAMGVLYSNGGAEGIANLNEAKVSEPSGDPSFGGSEAWFEGFIDYWNGPGAWKLLPQAAREGFLRVGRKVFYEVDTLLRDRTPADAYKVISAPALLLSGETSPIAARQVVEILATTLPNGKRRTIAGAGHMAPIFNAADVNRLIGDHIANA